MNGLRRGCRQAGAVGLLFTAVLMALVSLAALSFLYSLRYGHWPMQEAWATWSKSDKVNQIQQEIKSAAGQAAAPGGAEVRRCMIAGKLTYSNVECKAAGSLAVKLHDSRGIEAPRQPAPAEQQIGDDGQLKDKMLEKAISTNK
ncbi:MAG: hypothetical protein V4634_05670 [Pseudomonadota bacterium]